MKDAFYYNLPNLIVSSNLDFANVCESFPLFIDAPYLKYLNNKNIIDITCPVFNNFIDGFNGLQYNIRDSDYVAEVQSYKALSYYNINLKFNTTNPVLKHLLCFKVDALSVLKTNHIVVETVGLENIDVNQKLFDLHHYDLNQDRIAFYHKVCNLEYQPHLIDRNQINYYTDSSSSSSTISSPSLTSSSSSSSSSSNLSSPSKLIRRS